MLVLEYMDDGVLSVVCASIGASMMVHSLLDMHWCIDVGTYNHGVIRCSFGGIVLGLCEIG